MWARPLLCPDRASLTMWCDHGRRVGCWREPSVRFSSSRRGGEDALDDPIFFCEDQDVSFVLPPLGSSFPAFPILSSLKLKS